LSDMVIVDHLMTPVHFTRLMPTLTVEFGGN